ncbi:MAG: glycosyltransferase family 4 protein [Phycisphaerales bacterium]|nr:glycosyltransferase family 4 protein [Phycisphaerales bacterium]
MLSPVTAIADILRMSSGLGKLRHGIDSNGVFGSQCLPDDQGAGRRVAVLAAHHVRAQGWNATGGAEKYTLLVIDALLRAGADVRVGYSGNSIYDMLANHPQGAHLELERLDWVNESMSGDARLYPGTVLARRRWLRDTRAETLFVVQQGGGGAFGAALVAGRLLGMRVVSSIRQLPVTMPAPTGKRWLKVIPSPELWRRRLIWRRRIPAWCCDAIIFNSERVAKAHFDQARHPRHRVRIIYNGEQACFGGHETNGLPCRIASVGRVTEAKGADLLLSAFGRIADRHPRASLTYYGEGPLVPALRVKADTMGLGDRIMFAGYEPNRDTIYKNIDICVQPSRRESMSNSVVEAMARGIPCIVTDVGGLPETVLDGQTGFVVRPDQPEACAEAISRLLTDRETYARFATASLDRVQSVFSLDRIMEDTVNTILGLAPEAK